MLKRWTLILLILSLVLLAAGCETPVSGPSAPAPVVPTLTGDALPFPNGGAPVGTQPGESSLPAPTEAPPPAETRPDQGATEPGGTGSPEPGPAPTQPAATEQAASEPPETASRDAGPAVLSMGLYSGPFPEDGSGEAVESVAVLLVENRSEVQLQFAELHYRIDQREAVFRVSELPPGAQCMTAELNRLVATPISVWEAEPEQDLAVWQAAEPWDLELSREADGRLRVTNRGKTAASFDLIYKQRGEDGSFVGGIAYHVAVPALGPGESETVEAPHFTERSAVVRITARDA